VDLPKPDCAVRPSDCADIDVLNTLDGFNIQPRISIPFSGPIDVTTVSSQSVFLIGPQGRRVGINQVVWEPAANTLHVESDEQLRLTQVPAGRHTRRPRLRQAEPRWLGLLARAPRTPALADKAYRTRLLPLGASIFAGRPGSDCSKPLHDPGIGV
jgi:hypothetical protein